MTCRGWTSQGQGIKRFCLQPMEAGANFGGTDSHKTKAAVVAGSWHVKVGIRGSQRAGLVDKRLDRGNVLEEDTGIFDTESHDAGGWSSKLQVARMVKMGAVASLRSQTDTGIITASSMKDYAQMPAKRVRIGDIEESKESPSWVDVGTEGQGFSSIRAWTPLARQEEVYTITLANFELIKREMLRAAGKWSDALDQI
jgi:hypothetical protein